MTLELPFLKKRKFWFNLGMKDIQLLVQIISSVAVEFEVFLTVLGILAMNQVSYIQNWFLKFDFIVIYFQKAMVHRKAKERKER